MTATLSLSPVESGLLLAVCRVGHRHPLLAPLGLHGADVEDEICALDALSAPRTLHLREVDISK